MRAFLVFFWSYSAIVYAGGFANTRIGKPCVAGNTAMQIYSDADHGGNVDLSGQVAVVTGADTGIGLEICRGLAARNATIVMAARNITHAALAAANIRKDVPNANIMIPAAIDLSSLAKTRAFAQAAHKALGGGPVNILVNDAAMSNNPHGYTTSDMDQNGQPFEMLFEVNYVAPWLLTELFMPQLRAGKGRVVNLVSSAYRLACEISMRKDCMALDSMPPKVVTTDPNKTVPILNIRPSNYGISKLLMIRWTEELARRETASGVMAFTTDSGFVNTTMASQSSPFWNRFACYSDGRKGAPCPLPSDQGALSPTFLALSPSLAGMNGQYFEWCANYSVARCIDSVHDMEYNLCALSNQTEKESLWALSAEWVKQYSAPLTGEPALEEALVQALEVPATAQATQWSCPDFLKPLCSFYNITECAQLCKAQLTACTSDPGCRSSLLGAGECMVESQFKNTSAQNALTCLIPDNQLRDVFFQCLLETHNCIPVPKDGPIYPTCRDTHIAGDRTYVPSNVAGDWWKVSGWTKGEPYECRPCSKVQFWNASLSPAVPGGKDAPAKTDSQTMIISSTWQELDPKGKVCQMNDTSYFGPRPARFGFPAKMQHYGTMLGLSYQENFTVVHDGTQEAEPFVFLYGCGESLQGAYTTGLVLATVPQVSAALHARIGAVASANGFDAKDWCKVDNSCAKH